MNNWGQTTITLYRLLLSIVKFNPSGTFIPNQGLNFSNPLTPTLSLRERGLSGTVVGLTPLALIGLF